VDALMRIAHMADTHLGFQRWSYLDEDGRNQRESDVYRVFDQAIDQMIEREVEAVIHAGDLFEASHPPTRALEVALDGFARLREAGIPAIAIPGNHSTPRSAGAAHVFGLLERFGVQTIWGEPGKARVGELAVTGVPHDHRPDTLRDQIKASRPDPKATFNVLVLHVGTEGLAGAGDRETAAVELEPEILEEGAEFDYMALGHLHSHDRPVANACYAGSLERLTFQDTARKKGWVEVDLSAAGRKGFLRLVEVEPRPSIQLDPVDASGCDDLLPLLEAALSKYELRDAMVRVPVVGVDQSTWRALDRDAWTELTEPALHAELQAEFATVAAGPVAASLQVDDFLRSRVAKGLDPDVVVERAQGFLAQAAEELAEA
jgi:DNA repair exonuclease SbcCD nuclease subunit